VSQSCALIFASLEDLILNTYEHKKKTYLELGWDERSIKKYLGKKENALKLASFKTPMGYFDEQTGRNRYNLIYNRPDMMDLDLPWENSIDVIHTLLDNYNIFVISSRNKSQEEKTMEYLLKMGYPAFGLKVFFKEPTQSLTQHRTKCIEEIKSTTDLGIAVVSIENDVIAFDRVGFISVGFTSLKDKKEWKGVVKYIANDWTTLAKILNDLIEWELIEWEINDINENPIQSVSVIDVDRIKEIQSIIDQAVFHQLFLGEDRIMGSSEEDNIVIADVEDLLALFMVEVKKQLESLLSGNLDAFFDYFTEKFHMDFTKVKEISQANIMGITGLDNQELAITYMVLVKFVESVRNQAFELWGMLHIKTLYEEITGKPYDGPVIKRVEKLIAENNPNMVLLFNVSFIEWLATQFPEHPTSMEILMTITPKLQILAKKIFL
jgi:hypothetical protein